MGKIDNIKILNFYSPKDTVNSEKLQMETVFAVHENKCLISKTNSKII